MKKCSVDDIMGGEILAEPVMTSNYQILLAEGTVLQKEYIQKFKELGITELRIQGKGEVTQQEIYITRIEVQNKVKDQVKNVMERHIYQENKELQQLSDTAEAIIGDILEEEDIVEKIIEIKDRSADLYEHSINCCTMSAILGLRLGFSQETLREVGVGCLLHDIGLRFISVPYDDIDMEEMSETQRAEYKKHTVYGYSSLEKEAWLSGISKKIILSHHEQLDGRGFPFKSKTILDEVGLVSVCDTFDEMICGIGCKRVKVYKAIEYLKTFKNVKFNGRIVDEFLKIMAFYPAETQVRLNTGELAVVIGQNKGFPERPVLRIIKNKENREVSEEIIRDLLNEKSVFIEDVIN